MRYAGEKRFNIWTVLTLILLALFLLFVVYPIGMLLTKSLFTGGELDLSYFVKFFTKKYYWSTLVNSFKVTIASTAVAVLIGLPMAYLLRSIKIPFSGLLNILIVISYLSPPFIGAYSWIQLLGRNGFITRILNAIFHVELEGIYGFPGIVLVFSLQSFPLIYMYVSGALKNLDNSLNEAAESLGCSAFQRVTKVIFPLVMPSLLAGMLLVFMRVFSDFGTPMIIGEGYKTFPVMLYTQFMGEVGTNDGFAATMCIIVIVIALMFFFLQTILGRRFTYSMTALKPMEMRRATGWRKVVSYAVVYIITFVAALPQLTVIITSFIGTINGSLFTGEFTLDNYRNIFAKGNTTAITNTYLFGLEAIVVVVICGILISYLSVRKRSPLTSILDVLTMFPYIIPGSVLGISLLCAFNGPPFLLGGTVIIHPADALHHPLQHGHHRPDQSQHRGSGHQPGGLPGQDLFADHHSHDAARRAVGCRHELDHPDQRAELVGDPLHQPYHDADCGHLLRGYPQQLRKCGRLFHDPDIDLYPLFAHLLQGLRQQGSERLNAGDGALRAECAVFISKGVKIPETWYNGWEKNGKSGAGMGERYGCGE